MKVFPSWRQMMILGLVIICHNFAFSQKTLQYDFWLDNGTDTKVSKSVTGNSNTFTIADSLNLSGVKVGLHTINWRVKADKNWSAVSSSLFYKTTVAANTGTVSYEYWFDGASSSAVVQKTSRESALIIDSASVASLQVGLHQFHLRFRTPDGRSSMVSSLFYKTNNANLDSISYEYWFDDTSKSALVKKTNGGNTLIVDSASVASLQVGLHQFYLRFRTPDGRSSVVSSLFYKTSSNTNSSVQLYEYWFDDESTKRTSIKVNVPMASGLVLDSVSTGNLKPGFHRFNIRFFGRSGWSAVSTNLFQQFDSQQQNISGIEYWWDNNPGNRFFKSLQFPSTGFVADELDASNLCRGKHIVAYRFRRPNGWSAVKLDTFFKTEPKQTQALADFDLVVEGTLLACQNRAQNAQQVSWIFGNGASSPLSNPFYTYPKFGKYKVCQIAANNQGCPKDTLCKSVDIQGIQEITPNKSGRNSSVTVRILGGGFQNGTKVRLVRKNAQSHIPESTNVESSTSIRASFQFQNAGLGFWTVRLDLPNGDSLLLVDGFEITEKAIVNLWVKISGDRVYRPGFQANYTINYGNEGGNDAEGVFLFINGLPQNAVVKIIGDTIDPKMVPTLGTIRNWVDPVPNYFVEPKDSSTYTGAFIPNIPANSVGTVRINVIIPPNVDNKKRYEITASLSPPSLEEAYWECMNEIGELAKDEIYEIIGGLGDLADCWSSLILLPSEMGELFKDYARSQKSGLDKIVLLKDYTTTIVSTLLSCASFFPQTKAVKVVIAICEIINEVNKFAGYAKIGYECGKFGAIAIDRMISGTGRALDPNIKLGPGASSTAHYFSTTNGIVAYTVMCENDTSATLPAQIITIVDTLDLSKFDLREFGFTFVNINNKTVNLFNTPRSFIQDINLVSATGYIARITGSIDTSKGIVKWVVNTLEPSSLQNTINPAGGILPPNLRKPQGEASFGFFVKRKDDLPENSIISNKASIVFDFNKAILTPSWSAVLDQTAPVSAIFPVGKVQSDTVVKLGWNSQDKLSGVREVKIYVSKNASPYQLWAQFDVHADSAKFVGLRGNSYRFYSVAIDSAGNIEASPEIPDAEVSILGSTSTRSIEGRSNSWLSQNRPNPFEQTTVIDFYLDRDYPDVELTIVDLMGRVVESVPKQSLRSGLHTLSIHLGKLPSGIYIYQLRLNPGVVLSKKMILTR